DAEASTMTLLDTNQGDTTKPGFSLMRLADNSLFFEISGGANGPVRYSGILPSVSLPSNQWYQLAIVGSGTGNFLKVYVTPASRLNMPVASGLAISGANGNYPTDANHDLVIGGRSDVGNNGLNAGATPFNGSMFDVAIFNQALSVTQIRQLL